MTATEMHHLRTLAFLMLTGTIGCGAFAQPAASPESVDHEGRGLIEQQRYADAEKAFVRWVASERQNPDAHFNLALSRALQGKTELALDGFQQTLTLEPGRADACFEIAAILLARKSLDEAQQWLTRGLKTAPADAYGLELAGTLHFLHGDRVEALRYWNRLDRPRVSQLEIISSRPIDRQSVADEIDLVPGSLLSYEEVGRARWRLGQHDWIRTVAFEPVPGVSADQYALRVRIDSRKGFGTPLEFLTNSFSGVAFRTLRLTYWNLGTTGATLDVLSRLDTRAKLASFSLRVPRPLHTSAYADVSYRWRDERWSFEAQGAAGEAANHLLRLHQVDGTVLIPVREPHLTVRAGVAFRWRNATRDVSAATANEPGPSGTGMGTSFNERSRPLPDPDSHNAVWMSAFPNLRLFGGRSMNGWRWNSNLLGAVAIGRYLKGADGRANRFSTSWENRVSSPQESTGVRLGLHIGWVSPLASLEDHFVLGVGPDASFQLRAHPVLQKQGLGSAPIAGQFSLANLTVAQELKASKWFRLGVLAFCDGADVARSYPDQHLGRVSLDTGVGVQIGPATPRLGSFTVMYGRNWAGRDNVVYFSAALR